MSGLDLAIAARAARPELPVLFTSGYGDPIVLKGRALPAGAIWLQKPYAEAALANALAALLRPVRDEGV
ncbi:response regulator [Acidiphilium sp. JA12-A1]|nr:response regulator [Acidiphilium sp. JA12-A1]